MSSLLSQHRLPAWPGNTLTEYGVAAALVLLVAIPAFYLVGSHFQQWFTGFKTNLQHHQARAEFTAAQTQATARNAKFSIITHTSDGTVLGDQGSSGGSPMVAGSNGNSNNIQPGQTGQIPNGETPSTTAPNDDPDGILLGDANNPTKQLTPTAMDDLKNELRKLQQDRLHIYSSSRHTVMMEARIEEIKTMIGPEAANEVWEQVMYSENGPARARAAKEEAAKQAALAAARAAVEAAATAGTSSP